MYWQKKEETMSRAGLERLQVERLKASIRRSLKSPFYKARFKEWKVTPAAIRKSTDIRQLPFTTREDLQSQYPYGFLTVPKDGLSRVHTSSGTTGKPKAVFFTRRDVDTAATNIARCLIMTGTRKHDVLQNMMTYGLFTGALVMHYGAEKIGMLVIPAGPGNSDRQIVLIQDFGTTTIHITPSYALYLATILESKGLDPRRMGLKRAFIGAEPYTEATRRKIEKIYGMDVYNSYGLTEMNGPGVAFECEEKSGMHLWEDSYLMEIIDPATGEPLPDGEEGELVLTTLTREAMPIFRYRTRDITRIALEKCPCGRTHRRIERITGRADDMFILRGVNIYPQQVERVLMSVKGVAQNYLIELTGLDEMKVKVEISRELFDGRIDHLRKIEKEIGDRLRSEILVKPRIELCEPGTLPASEGKAKRVYDTRKL